MKNRGRVLVVDDDAAARASLQAILSDEFDVDCAEDAQTARTILRVASYNTVVADFEMPGGTGLSLIRELGTTAPDTRGILVTGRADYPEVKSAREAWRDVTVVLKPYDPAALVRTVRNSVNMSRLRAATRRLGGSR